MPVIVWWGLGEARLAFVLLCIHGMRPSLPPCGGPFKDDWIAVFCNRIAKACSGTFRAGVKRRQAGASQGERMEKAGSFAYLPLERVVFGRPAADAATEEAARVGATRVFIVASKSLARNTPVIRTIAAALGPRYVGLFDGCVQHSPRASVIAAANAVRAAAPDLILTVGGGTVIDTVKVLQICLAHSVDTPAGLDGLHASIGPDGKRHVPEYGLRRCGRWSCRPRCPGPSSRTSPGSPMSASARNILSSARISARAP